MMWPLQCFILSSEVVSSMKMITKDMMLSSINVNILVMTLAALTLNELMILKESLNLEKNFHILMKIIGIMVMFAFVTSSPFKFLIMMEMTIYPLSLIILTSSKDNDKMESLKFMILLNTLGSIPFMMWIALADTSSNNPYSNYIMNFGTMSMILMMLFLIKTPIFMFHLWLTKVHVSASGNCSMILASIMIKLGTMGIFKFSENMKQEKLNYIFLSLALMTMVYFSMTMIRFFDAKTLIAMSSVLHMSMMLPMMAMKKSLTMTSSLMMMTSHGLISYFLFFLITMAYEKTENRSSIFMKSLEASSKVMAMMVMIFMFLNLGLPPFMNFYAEMSFFATMEILKSNLSVVIMGMSLLVSVIFTMQMSTNVLFYKMELKTLKSLSTLIMTKFTFFFMWTTIILWMI